MTDDERIVESMGREYEAIIARHGKELTRLRASHAELLAACQAFVEMTDCYYCSQIKWIDGLCPHEKARAAIKHAHEAPP